MSYEKKQKKFKQPAEGTSEPKKDKRLNPYSIPIQIHHRPFGPFGAKAVWPCKLTSIENLPAGVQVKIAEVAEIEYGKVIVKKGEVADGNDSSDEALTLTRPTRTSTTLKELRTGGGKLRRV